MATMWYQVTCVMHVLVAILSSTCANLLTNGGLEGDLGDWFCLGGCTVTPSADAFQKSRSAMVTNRNFKWNGIAQRPQRITTPARYELEAHVKLLNLTIGGALYDTVEMVIKCLDANNNDKPVYTKFGQVPMVRENIWTKIGGSNFLREGLQACLVYVSVWSPEVNYVIDDASLVEIPEMTNWRTKAEKKIEKHRKGTMIIRIARAPPGNYTVEIKQTAHAFAFGSVVGADEMVDPSYEKYQDFFYNNFQWGVLGNALKWNAMQRDRDVIDYERPRLALEALQSRGIKIRGHNVFWGVEKHIPEWVKSLSPTELLQEISDRTAGVVNFTKGIVEHWDVNNEVLHGDWFEQASGDPNMTLRMFEQVHAVDSQARLFLNDYGVLESNLAMGIRNQALLFKTAGVPIHAVGLQSHITPADVDITLLKKRLDTVSEAGLPIWITELSMDEPNATIKAQALTDVMTLYFGYPGVDGIILWGFWDGRIWKPDSKLFEGPDITPNEAGTAFLELMNKWTTKKTFVLTTGIKASFKAFKGHYSVVVKSGNTVLKTLNVVLDRKKNIKLRIRKRKN